jgi:hypothetical protein
MFRQYLCNASCCNSTLLLRSHVCERLSIAASNFRCLNVCIHLLFDVVLLLQYEGKRRCSACPVPLLICRQCLTNKEDKDPSKLSLLRCPLCKVRTRTLLVTVNTTYMMYRYTSTATATVQCTCVLCCASLLCDALQSRCGFTAYDTACSRLKIDIYTCAELNCSAKLHT